MSILVTGGAGYVGSHIVLALLDRGEEVIVVDNLSTGKRVAVAQRAHFIEGNSGDFGLMKRVLREKAIHAVIHCAGSIVAPESVEKPLLYYANNTVASRALVEACVAEGVRDFIFSSTALVYGPQLLTAMPETTPTQPTNPYGRSKLITEWIVEDAARAHGLRYVSLRYFNVAGADPKGRAGQSSPRATHLIKRACQAALKRVPFIEIFGTDFPTPDGTGVRDYIHVADLAAAHLLVLDHLGAGGASLTLNCGYGRGVSVREVIANVERVTGRKLSIREAPRRPGDPPALIADASRLKRELGWKPAHDSLDEIIASAYAWEERLTA
jgi:UDP-glucose 4-epimerase